MNINVVALDLGNGFQKRATLSGVIKTASYVGMVPPGSSYDNIELPDGAQVTYLGGDRPDLLQTSWLIGDAATRKTSYPEFAKNTGKIKISLQLVLGMLTDLCKDTDTLHIKTLITSLPDSFRDAQALRAKLGNTHTIQTKFGVCQVSWDEVIVLDEGEGAVRHALERGIVAKKTGIATIDPGCGTTIVSLTDKMGETNKSARKPLNFGVGVLAEMIGNDERFIRKFNSDFQVGLILEGIENGMKALEALNGATPTEPVFAYGEDGFFDEIFYYQRRAWIQRLMGEVDTVLGRFKSEVKTILIIGGGAPLLAPLAQASNGKIVVCSDCQYANALGLLKIANEMMANNFKSQVTSVASFAKERRKGA